jgi:glycosyltransferase involved in cell wall biosynthesis
MYLTVVVCTHNRPALLRCLLDSLSEASETGGTDVEILVIANACGDDTLRVLDAAKGPLTQAGLRLRWVEEPEKGKSHALNRALTMLTGDAVAFIDDDHRVDPDFLGNIARALREYADLNILCGRILPDWDGREPALVHDRGPYRIYPPPVPVFDAGDQSRLLDAESFKPGGGNLIFRLPLLKTLGRFSTDLGPQGHDLGGGEDSEFLQRALDLGEPLLYLPDIVQYHFVDLNRLKLSRMLRLSYQRSRASAGLHHGGLGGIPPFLWRKLLHYLVCACLSLSASRSRFYLVRTAAALGEIRGIAESRDHPADP